MEFWTKDEDYKPVSWILDEMVRSWGNKASWVLNKDNNPHEAGFLKLDCSKAPQKLQWSQKWDFKYTLESIIKWHKVYLSKGNVSYNVWKKLKVII